MQKLLNQKSAIKMLQDDGWQLKRGGKHVVMMVKEGVRRPITLPRHGGRTYGKSLTHEIIKEAGLNSKEASCSSQSSRARRGPDTGHGSGSSPDASPPPER